MAIEIFNRHEIKYLITQEQFERLMELVPQYMSADKFNRNGKPYSINNVYLDTDTDELIRTSLQKPVYKEKLRIRSYGPATEDSPVFFEIKKKYMGLVNKRRTALSLSQLNDYLEKGIIPEDEKINAQVFREIDYMMKRYQAYPKVYLSYSRFAFFAEKDSDFRMTLDTDILARRENVRIDAPEAGISLLPQGFWLMEAKAYKSFPLWFVNFLSENGIKQISFSKYGTEYRLHTADTNTGSAADSSMNVA